MRQSTFIQYTSVPPIQNTSVIYITLTFYLLMKNSPKQRSNTNIICPKCKASTHIIRSGTRKTTQGPKQQYYCKACKKYLRDSKLPYQHYPTNIILNTISTYNLGYTVKQTNTIINRKFKTKVPPSTIHSWLLRYQDICSFTSTLRKRYILEPNKIIFTKKLYHQQVYDYQYHTLKINIAGKTFPKLRFYLTSLTDKCPNEPFQYGPRCSQLRIELKPQKTIKHNHAPRMAELALTLAKTNHERHQKVLCP